MTKNDALASDALLTVAVPAFAQTAAAPLTPPAAPLTPPAVLGKPTTIRFTSTEILGANPVKLSAAVLAQPNKALIQDMNPKTQVIDTT